MRYAKYKPTNIPWLPEVPETWEVKKMKYHFYERSEKGHPDEAPLCSTQAYGVIPQSMYENRIVIVDAKNLAQLKLVKKGDFVISLRAFQGGIEIAHYQGIISAAYTILELRDKANSNYFRWLFKSRPFIGLLKTCVTGIREGQNINYPLLSQKSLPLPPLAEQKRIVAYLDEKCAKIDTLVTAKTKQIELFKELRQSIIAEAVTKGIDGCKTFKPTNIPWLPEVPETWEVAKVRQYFRLRSEKVSEKDYPALSVAKIGVVPQLSDVAISMAEGDSRKLVREGDFVVNSRSDRKGSCGIAPRDGSVTTISIVLEPRRINHKYVHYLFRSVPWVEEFYRNGRGIVADLWTTRYQEMRNMLFPYPPLAEQKRIVAYLDKKCAKIDTLVAKIEDEVVKLKEYRERLVADVVTGQRKVVK